MVKKVILILFALFILINAVNATDSTNWTNASVGYEEFKIPPQYEDPYKNDFNMYEFDEDIDVFTIRYVNPNIMSLYGYFLEHNTAKKTNISGHDAIHFTSYNRQSEQNNSKLWFSSGEDFYYITWNSEKITPEINEIIKTSKPSKYSHEKFYSILDEEYKNYKIVNAIESQRIDYPRDNGHHTFTSIGTNGFSFGVIN